MILKKISPLTESSNQNYQYHVPQRPKPQQCDCLVGADDYLFSQGLELRRDYEILFGDKASLGSLI